MNQRLYCLGLSSVLACSGGAAVQAAAPRPSANYRSSTPIADRQTAPVTLAYEDASERDRVFIENAERAIAQYSEFLARAGEREEYAQAVKRSREQIEDLRAAIDFVRAGSAQRTAH